MNINHLGILSLFLLGTLLAEDREFISLFNGKDLSGWKTTGTGFPKTMDRSSLNQSPTKKVGKGIQTI
jgi:hypothetical protein